MICGLLAKIAMTATLLGNQELKVENYDHSSELKHCTTTEPSNANATVVLRDAHGKPVFESQIRVGQFDFYLNDLKRGGVPAKSASFLYTYPLTEKTKNAISVELKLHGRSYKQSAKLQNVTIGMK